MVARLCSLDPPANFRHASGVRALRAPGASETNAGRSDHHEEETFEPRDLRRAQAGKGADCEEGMGCGGAAFRRMRVSASVTAPASSYSAVVTRDRMATARPLGCAAKPMSFWPFSGGITVSWRSKPARRRICVSTIPGYPGRKRGGSSRMSSNACAQNTRSRRASPICFTIRSFTRRRSAAAAVL